MAKIPKNCITPYFHALDLLLISEVSTNQVATSVAVLENPCSAFLGHGRSTQLFFVCRRGRGTRPRPYVRKSDYLRDV